MTLTLKRRLLSVSALFLMVITIISGLIVPANAATRSSGRSTQTIVVHTKANWFYPGSSSITIKQSKGVITFSERNWKGQVTSTKTKKTYGSWKVVAKATDGSHKIEKKLTGSSLKLNLKPNKTYTITMTFLESNNFKVLRNAYNPRWTTYPSWRIGGTWKVSSYY